MTEQKKRTRRQAVFKTLAGKARRLLQQKLQTPEGRQDIAEVCGMVLGGAIPDDIEIRGSAPEAQAFLRGVRNQRLARTMFRNMGASAPDDESEDDEGDGGPDVIDLDDLFSTDSTPKDETEQ